MKICCSLRGSQRIAILPFSGIFHYSTGAPRTAAADTPTDDAGTPPHRGAGR
jgi:hypothetical protein